MMPMNKNYLKFLSGVAAGIALALATRSFMSSRTGRTMQRAMKDMKYDFFRSVMPKLRDLKEASEADYKEFMAGAAENYVKAKKLSGEAAKRFMSEALGIF